MMHCPSSLAIILVGCLAAMSESSPTGPILHRQARQVNTNTNNIQEFPVKIAGGNDAFRPSVGALSSRPIFNTLSAGDRFEAPPPPVIFGPRPRPRPQPVFRPQFYRPWYF